MAAGTSLKTSSVPSASSPENTVFVPWNRFEHFVGQFTHDVRNGLNALELQLTFLGEISTDPEAVDEVKRLRTTLHEITRQLQAVKLATAPITPNVLDYPAADLFEDLRERVERLHPEAAGKVAWNTLAAPEVSLLVDPDLTITCLLELFANSFWFGGSSIQCSTASGPHGVSFVLQELSAAAPPIDTEHWGEPLLTSRRNAYGLGLFRVRRILEAQGGTFTPVYSPSDQRLTLTAVLPCAAQAGKA